MVRLRSLALLLLLAAAGLSSGQTLAPPPDGPYRLAPLASLLPSAASVSAAGASDGAGVYLFGGVDHHGGSAVDRNPSDRIVHFTAGSQDVSLLEARLPSPRWAASAVWSGSRFYVFGGVDGMGNALDEIVAYDPRNDTVTVAGHLPTPRAATGAVWDGHEAWILGGVNNDALTEVVRFDPASGLVETMAAQLPLPYVAKSSAGAFWAAGAVYLFGNYARGTAALEFVPGAGGGHALELEPLPEDVDDGGGFYDGTDIYLMGADARIGVPASHMLRFSPRNGTAIVLNDAFPADRDEFAAAFIAPNGYIFGGNDRDPSPEILCYGPACSRFATTNGTAPPTDVVVRRDGCEWPREPAAQWTMERADAGGSGNADAGFPIQAYAWRVHAGDGRTAPSVAGCRVFVGSGDRIEARAASDGRLQWSNRLGGHLRASPAIAAGVVYAATDAPSLVALDAASGRILWAVALRSVPDQAVATPAVQLLGGAGGFVQAVADGRLAWVFNPGGAVGPPVLQATAAAYATALRNGIGRVHLRSGTSVGTPLDGDGTGTATPHLVAAGPVLVATAGAQVRATDANASYAYWRSNATGSLTAPVVVAGTVVAASSDGGVYAFALANGTLLWHQDLGSPAAGPPTLAGGFVVVPGADGVVHAYVAGGVQAWSSKVAPALSSGVAAMGPWIVVAAPDGSLMTLDAATGNFVRTPETSAAPPASSSGTHSTPEPLPPDVVDETSAPAPPSRAPAPPPSTSTRHQPAPGLAVAAVAVLATAWTSHRPRRVRPAP